MKTGRTMLLAGCALASLSTPAFAQQAAPGAPTPQTGSAPDSSGDIIVTAQFIAQRPIDVPIALTAFDGKTLERIGAEDFEALSRFVPGFQVQNQSPNDPGFVMRGITSDAGAGYTEPRVSVFQDGVSISKSRGAYIELFDLERVEVAKGPQTTLYGRSALIGAVNVIQNKAKLGELSGYVRGEYGNFDHWLGEAAINLPLGDSTALRFSGRINRRDGIVDNLAGGKDYGSVRTWAVRGALRIAPGNRFKLDVIGNYQHDDPTGTAFIALEARQTDPTTGALLAPLSPFGGVALTTNSGLEGGKPLGLDRVVYGVTGLAEYKISDAFTLNSVSAWRRFRALELFDADGIALPLLNAADDGRGRQYSQDLRLRWDNGGALSAFFGGSYFHETGSQRTPTFFDEFVTLAQLTGALNGRIAGRPLTDPAPLSVLHGIAFAAQNLKNLAAAHGVTVSDATATAIAANLKTQHQETSTNYGRTDAADLFTDFTFRPVSKLELNAGIRYTHSSKRSGLSATVLNGRSVLGGYIGALSQPLATQNLLLFALGVPGVANIPQSAAFPLPLFGLAGQPTINNGDIVYSNLKDGGVSFRTTARFAPNRDLSFYAGYARGRRPEELSALPPSVPFDPPRFDTVLAETVDSFEVGAKAALLDRHLSVDVSLFHYLYRNFQTTEQVGILFVQTNAGKAHSTGLEAQFRYVASRNVELFGSYAWNRSRFLTGARRGNHFRLSPDYSASLGAMLTVPVGSGGVSFVPTVTWQSKTFFDDDNDRSNLQQPPNALVADNIQDEFQPAFALVNARLGYAPAKGNWRIEVFADNLLDKKYLKDAGNTGDGLGLPTAVRGTPRTYGISLRVNFGG